MAHTSSSVVRPIKASFRRLRALVIGGLVVANLLVLALASYRSGDFRHSAVVVLGFAALSSMAACLVLHLLARILRESMRAQLYLHHASDGVHILDADGNLIEASEQFCHMLGYTRDEVIGMNVTQWDARWSASELLGVILPARLRADDPVVFETRHRHKDGTLIEVEVNTVTIELDGKRYIYASSRDIGDKMRQQRALQDSAAQLRLAATVFSHAHEGIMICDPAQTILDVNPTFCEITGYARDEIIGKTPRVLSSGRQDGAFYQAMWESIGRQGHWEGEIWNRRRDGSLFAERLTVSTVHDEQGRISHYIGTFYDITVLKEQQARLEHLAHFDPLTGLPNRSILAEHMNQALAKARRGTGLVAVCYLDLDGFKEINDAHGHETGDALLVEVAGRLRDTVRGGDTVARLGGDEFVLLLHVDSIEECRRVADRVLHAMATPICALDKDCCVSASLGITVFPMDDADPDTLLRHADLAMYQAKQAGKNRYQMFAAQGAQAPANSHSATSTAGSGREK